MKVCHKTRLKLQVQTLPILVKGDSAGSRGKKHQDSNIGTEVD